MNRYLVAVAMLAAAVAGCSSQRTVQKTETIMGTQVSVTVVAASRGEAEAAIEAGMAEVRRFDAMMSLYKHTSEITKVNLAAGLTYSFRHVILLLSFAEGGLHGNQNPRMVLVFL